MKARPPSAVSGGRFLSGRQRRKKRGPRQRPDGFYFATPSAAPCGLVFFMSPQVLLGNSGEIIMNGLNTVKNWLGALVDIGLVLLALGIVLALLAGPQVPFLGNVVTNIVTVIGDLGKSGIVGLIAVGVVLWLFKRAVP